MFEQILASGASGSNSLDMSSSASTGDFGAVNIGGSTFNNAGSGNSLSTMKLLLIGGCVLVGLFIWKKVK